MSDLVRSRLDKWSTDRELLWKDVLERSRVQATSVHVDKPKSDNERVEAAVVAALRIGDVRKALQMLNSAPIAPKTEATLER